MRDIFYPDYVSEEEKQEVRNSSLWPLVAGIHSISGGKLTAGSLHPTDLMGGGNYVAMYTSLGEQAFRVIHNPSSNRYGINAYNLEYRNGGDDKYKLILTSNKPNYILKKLAEDRSGKVNVRKRANAIHCIGPNLASFIVEVETNFHRGLWNLSTGYLSKLFSPSATTSTTISASCVEELLCLYTGEVTSVQMSAGTRRALDAEIAARNKRNESISTASKKVRDLLGKDKWLVVTDKKDRCVRVGTVNMTPIVDHVTSSRNIFYFAAPADTNLVRCSVLTDVKMYKSLGALPATVKDKIYPAMTFAKVMSSYPTKVSELDPDGMLIATLFSDYNEDTGMVSSYGYHLFDK